MAKNTNNIVGAIAFGVIAVRLYRVLKTCGRLSGADLLRYTNTLLASRGRPTITNREMRAIIAEMRLRGALICSTGGRGGGYWLADSLDDVLDFTNRELRSRALNLLVTARAMRREARRQFGGQMNYFQNGNSPEESDG